VFTYASLTLFFPTIVLRLALCGAVAEAQQPAGKIWRIGFLTSGSVSEPRNVLRFATLRQALGELGYVEGKNINIDYRYAEGKSERLDTNSGDAILNSS
jgi:putative ABC transport system substrate-binding protein